MKRFYIAMSVFLLTLSISTSAYSHSRFEESNPADGDILTETLNEIVLEFEGEIEQGSFIDVKTIDGKSIELQEVMISGSTLTGVIDEPLVNDEYQVNWSIVSADGHPLEGGFSFIVNAPVSEFEEEITEAPSETDEEAVSEVETTAVDQEEAGPAEELETESSSMETILIVLLVVLGAGGSFILTKRKK
ncbi:copper resistance CopC family protein [Oceanobacillus damuensis]|uniref:copper resistance CopC family protein n=1 Tax=Oceanobacillus damuensis TaxID=937928 RepID=UPI0008353281|nr:copper resistance protein CopC [Oceanobacillus damuensis]